MKIYAMRHGVTELNKKKIVNGQIDEPLAPEGEEQARSTIGFLPVSITHIYASPLQRAEQTAQIVNSIRNLPISIHNELTEVHMGSLAGKSWKDMESGLELKKKHRSVQFDYQVYGGESVDDVKRRLLVFLKNIRNKHADHEALIITHGGIVRVLQFLERGTFIDETVQHLALLTFDLDAILR